MKPPRFIMDFSSGEISLQEGDGPAVLLPQVLEALGIGSAPNGSLTRHVGDVLIGNVQAQLRARRSPFVLLASLGPPEDLNGDESIKRSVEIGAAVKALIPHGLDRFQWGTLELPWEPEDLRDGRKYAVFTVVQRT